MGVRAHTAREYEASANSRGARDVSRALEDVDKDRALQRQEQLSKWKRGEISGKKPEVDLTQTPAERALAEEEAAAAKAAAARLASERRGASLKSVPLDAKRVKEDPRAELLQLCRMFGDDAEEVGQDVVRVSRQAIKILEQSPDAAWYFVHRSSDFVSLDLFDQLEAAAEETVIRNLHEDSELAASLAGKLGGMQGSDLQSMKRWEEALGIIEEAVAAQK